MHVIYLYILPDCQGAWFIANVKKLYAKLYLPSQDNQTPHLTNVYFNECQAPCLAPRI